MPELLTIILRTQNILHTFEALNTITAPAPMSQTCTPAHSARVPSAMPAATYSFAKGDAVYYYSPEGDTVPARVLKAGPKKVLIYGDFLTGARNAWVSPGKLELQIKPEAVALGEWPVQGYLIAAEKLEEAATTFLHTSEFEADAIAEALLLKDEVAAASRSLLAYPDLVQLALFMRAGQSLWRELLKADRFRRKWSRAHDAWRACWLIYQIKGQPPLRYAHPETAEVSYFYRGVEIIQNEADPRLPAYYIQEPGFGSVGFPLIEAATEAIDTKLA